MSIRVKILALVVAVAVVCATVIGLLAIYVVRAFVSDFNEEQLGKASNLALTLLEQNSEDAARASGMAAGNEQLIEAISKYNTSGERRQLVNTSISLLNATGVNFLTVMDVSGNVLARAHEPENYGDSLANQANVQNAMRGTQYTTIEKGSAVKLSVRCGTPVYDQAENLIGVVSLGYRLDQNAFVDYVKRMTGAEVTVFLGDTRVSTTILNENGDRVVDTKASKTVSEQVLAGGDYVGKADVLGQSLLSCYLPIRDVEGVILGMLFVGLDTTSTDERMMRDTWIMVAVVLLLAIAAMLIAVAVSNKLTRPIREMSAAAMRLAAGDVDVEIAVTRDRTTRDETAHLALAFSDMIHVNRERARLIGAIAGGDLRGSIKPSSDKDVVGAALDELLRKNNLTFSKIRGAASHLDTASTQIANGAQTLAQGSTEQAAAIEELSASISDITSQTDENATVARKAARLADTIKTDAEKGSGQMERMTQAVREINEASVSIGKVIKVIDDIAFQTNILALNAAVEAARAGQHGKGFAVVADEVRNLASKSAEAARDTGVLISNSMEKAELGASITGETAQSLSKIIHGINESAILINSISNSFEMHLASISQINDGIEQVSRVVQQNTATAEESAAASEEMSAQAATLHELIGRFKIREDGLNDSPVPRSVPDGNFSLA